MKRTEKSEKLHFLQMSDEFFEDIKVKRLIMTGGNDALTIYLRVWCKALKTGGVLELETDMEPSEEIAMRIGNGVLAPMVASTMTMCQAYGLITTEDSDGRKFINFSMTQRYTRAWTKEAIARREDKAAALLEDRAAKEPAEIEEKPETEEEQKKREKKEAKQKKLEEHLAQFLEVWKKEDMPKVLKLTPERKKKLIARIDEYGIENMINAIEIASDSRFLRGMGPTEDGKKPWKATIDFFCRTDAVTRILEGRYDFAGRISDMKPEAPPAAPEKITEEIVDGTILQDGITRKNWDQVKGRYSMAMQEAIEAAL